MAEIRVVHANERLRQADNAGPTGRIRVNAASLPQRAETSYLEPNAAQIEAFQRNYDREQRCV